MVIKTETIGNVRNSSDLLKEDKEFENIMNMEQKWEFILLKPLGSKGIFPK